MLHFTTNGEVKLNYSFESSIAGSGSEGLVSATSGNTSNCRIRFNLTFKVIQKGGSLTTSGSTVSVTDADEITVVFGVGTNYDIDSPTFYSGESDNRLAERVRSTVESAASLGWQALYDNHIAEYSPSSTPPASNWPKPQTTPPPHCSNSTTKALSQPQPLTPTTGPE